MLSDELEYLQTRDPQFKYHPRRRTQDFEILNYKTRDKLLDLALCTLNYYIVNKYHNWKDATC